MDEIVNRESRLRTSRLDTLKKLSKTYTEMMKTKRENIRKLAQQAGSDDRQTLVLQKQFAMEHLASLRKELSEIESQKRKAEAILRTRRPDTLQETAAPLVSNAEVDRLVEEDPGVSGLSCKPGRHAAPPGHGILSQQAGRPELGHGSGGEEAPRGGRLAEDLVDEEACRGPSPRDPEGSRIRNRASTHPRGTRPGSNWLSSKMSSNTSGPRSRSSARATRNRPRTPSTCRTCRTMLAQIQQAATKLSSEVEMLNVEHPGAQSDHQDRGCRDADDPGREEAIHHDRRDHPGLVPGRPCSGSRSSSCRPGRWTAPTTS